MWNSYEGCNICVMRVSEGEKAEKGTEEISETVITANFPKLKLDTKPQIQESQKTPSRIKQNKTKSHVNRSISFTNYRKSKVKKKF